MKPTPVKIAPNAESFIANGKTYHIQNYLTMGRLKPYKQMLHTLAFGAGVEDHKKFLDFVIAQLSGPVTFLATHKILENAFNAVKAYESFVSDDVEPWFRFGALFINREGEDVARWDESIVKSKIDDWIKEGIDVESFFFICARQEPILRVKFLRSVPGLQKDDAHLKNPTSPGGTT